ncbi:hypothetical protein BRD17_06545 [Halobacteriales archaeon SW_7_68_16]|nr:MAG: hypothetical protein BRD17_06545 [Halobacteriales archaeon SW_7_68_16]
MVGGPPQFGGPTGVPFRIVDLGPRPQEADTLGPGDGERIGDGLDDPTDDGGPVVGANHEVGPVDARLLRGPDVGVVPVND